MQLYDQSKWAEWTKGSRADVYICILTQKETYGTSNKKPDEDFSAPINIERGPPGDSFEVTLPDAE